ncbi:hypothetical protein [Halomonas chromatireducens]|uniref:Uncharacterized protein n=1 Tax=Halomonas chromatireducens TaxID=507626 RepID=A0A120JWR2_9GAMM|nr:hypothetical protein [Halomonas chromatireducens]AMD02392.1 hypothetical protein LOKO_03348 [Halomonas chromatireducens]
MSGFNIISEGDHFDSDGEYRPFGYLDGEEMPDGTTCSTDIDKQCQPSRGKFSAGGSSAGDGVLIIDGNVEFNGNPEFQGLIIVLGDYTVKGGGGGDLEGSIIAAPYSCRDGNCVFNEVNIDLTGGGGNDYLHVLEYLDAAWELLGSVSPEAARLWLEGNNPGGNFTYMARGWREITVPQ